MKEYALVFDYRYGWSITERDEFGYINAICAPAPTLEDALRHAQDATGAPVAIKLITKP